MSEWRRVKWSEARQVLEILDLAKDTPADQGAMAPVRYFAFLRENDRLTEAVKFLGQALPRLEAVAWAARTVRDLTPPNADRDRPEARALRAALLWVSDPTEARRRAALDAAETCSATTPEFLAAMATFFSGGSIAPANCPQLPAARDAAGRFAAVAVISAAARTQRMQEALNAALDAGALIASQGLEAAAA